MTCGIYAIERIETGKRYIGSSVDIEKRWKVHLYRLRIGTHWSRRMQNSWNKNGESAFRFLIVEIVDDPNFLLPREQCWIWRENAVCNGYNSLECPDRLSGFRHSEESRTKMSIAKKGRRSAKRGIPLSTEQKEKMSTARLGKTQPKWWAQKAAAARIGLKRSSETRQKMSDSRKRGIIDGRIIIKPVAWTEEMRAALSDRLKDCLPIVSSEERSRRMKMHLSDPTAREKNRERIIFNRHLAFTPEARAKHAAKIRRKWADPEYKARVGRKISEGWARRRATKLKSV